MLSIFKIVNGVIKGCNSLKKSVTFLQMKYRMGWQWQGTLTVVKMNYEGRSHNILLITKFDP